MNKFKLTRNHILLLENAFIVWNDCETGAPEIDPKRPYGNSSVAIDVCEILGIEPACKNCGYSDLELDMAMAFHEETETALQIIFQAQSFEEGWYEQSDVSPYKWRKAR